MYNNKCSGNNNIVVSKCNLFKIKSVIQYQSNSNELLFTDYDSIYSITILTFLSFILQILIKPFRTFKATSFYHPLWSRPNTFPNQQSRACRHGVRSSCRACRVVSWSLVGWLGFFMTLFVDL